MTATKKDLKEAAVRFLGGECAMCGYKRSNAALHFHHLNPHEKDFNISSKSNWYDIHIELKKCILLCANCHAEAHTEIADHETLAWLYEQVKG